MDTFRECRLKARENEPESHCDELNQEGSANDIGDCVDDPD